MASKSLGTLTLDLVAKIGGFTGPLDKAERKTKDSTKKMAGYAKNVGIAFAAAGVAAAAGLAALARQSINTADEMSKTAKIVAINIEDLSALRHAADLSGVSFGELSSGLNRFNRSNADAFEGIGAGADAYEALGISVKNTDGVLKSNYELIEGVADAFASMEDGAVKSSVAQDLFGRSGAKLIPLLNGGRAGMAGFADEAERLGLVFSQETGSAAEQFNDNLRRLQLTMVGLGNRIAAEALPALVEFTDVLADPEVQAGLASIAAGIVSVGTAAVTAVSEIANFTRWLAEEVAVLNNGIAIDDLIRQEQLLQELEGLQEKGAAYRFMFANNYMDDDYLQEQIGFQREHVKYLQKEQELYAARANRKPVQDSVAPGVAVGASGDEMEFLAEVGKMAAEAGKEMAALNQEVDKQAALFKEQLALTGEVTELEKIRYAITSGALVGINAEQQNRLEDLASEIDAQEKLAELERESAEQAEKIASQYQAARDVLIDQDERLKEAAAERYEAFRAAMNAGLISEEQFSEQVVKNTALLNEQIDALKSKTNELDEFTKNAAESMQRELGDALMGGFDGGSDDMLKRWRDLLKRMLADAVAADLARAAFGQENSTGSGSNTGQMVGNIIGLFAGFFDSGGNIPSGKFGVVGERGPELVAGPATVTGRRDTAAMMGGRSVSIGNLIFPGVTNAREAEVAAGAAGRKISSIVASSARYG